MSDRVLLQLSPGLRREPEVFEALVRKLAAASD
jgi:hypothetical protein